MQQKQQPQKSTLFQKIQPVKPNIDLLPPLPSAPEGLQKISSSEKLPLLGNRNKIVIPQLPIDLLPPLENQPRPTEDASTQGPPIYYEWKIPASGLEPPKFDNETETNNIAQGPTRRSVQGEANFGENNEFQGSQKKTTVLKSNTLAFPYKTLQKHFSIPEFEFPIEPTGRVGYDNQQAVNSFQVKIPPTKNPNQERTYYLESSKCPPECHPQYFRPGTCEPCVRIR